MAEYYKLMIVVHAHTKSADEVHLHVHVPRQMKTYMLITCLSTRIISNVVFYESSLIYSARLGVLTSSALLEQDRHKVSLPCGQKMRMACIACNFKNMNHTFIQENPLLFSLRHIPCLSWAMGYRVSTGGSNSV